MSDYILDGPPDVDDPDALVGEGKKMVGLVFGEVFVYAPERGLFSLVDMYAKLRERTRGYEHMDTTPRRFG